MLDIILILDESSSMSVHSKSYIQGVNAFISTQKQLNPMANFSFIKFSTIVNTLCIDSKMHTLPEFTIKHYEPWGVTSLYDAIGHGINLKYTNTDTPNTNVIMIIITDGEDNNSFNYTIETITERIKNLKKYGWEFVFIAANQNATRVGTKMGINTCLTYNASPHSISQVVNACNISVGHATHKWTGIPNQYTQQQMPTDVRDLMDELEKFTI